MDNYPISSNSLERHYSINGNYFGIQYKDHLSDFHNWEQKYHAAEWVLFPENIGSHLSIDETALTNGELYTIVTNKSGKGKKGTLVAMIAGTRAENVIEVLEKIPEDQRDTVKEVTLDMAGSMRKIVCSCFLKASQVIDRFHVQKLAYDALQEMRISHRWDAINEETNARENAKENKKKYVPDTFCNGDSRKQLLARSRYLLFKSGNKWTEKQKKKEQSYYLNFILI